MVLTNYKRLAKALIAIGAAVAVSGVQAETDAKAELLALADEMEPFSLRMLGPPVGTSEWSFVVKPFWEETVTEISNGKVSATLNSVTDINADPADALRLVSQGTFDMTNMIANYGSGEVPALDGLDLAGVATSTELIKEVLQAYEPAVDEALQQRYTLRSLGVGMSGAQTFFCRGEVNGVEDLKGKKVRVSSSTISEFVEGLDAAPVTMAFGELVPALQRGVIDCVITGTMSGNTAKLYEVSDTLFTVIVGWAPSIQVVNSNRFDQLDENQQVWLTKALDYYYRNISDVIQEENVDEGIWCNTGDDRCGKIGEGDVTDVGQMTLVEPSDADLEKVREVVESRVLPAYGKACPDCIEAWNDTVGKVVDMEIPAQ